MAIHLTSDNHKAAALGDGANHLAAVKYGGANHLVSITQASAWTNKEIIVNPDRCEYKAAMAIGEQTYPNQQNTNASVIYNDTSALFSALKARLEDEDVDWTIPRDSSNAICGYPTYGYWIRGHRGPLYATASSWSNKYAECGMSMTAWRFNLHRLHFSRFTSYNVYLRIWNPSLMCQVSGNYIPPETVGSILSSTSAFYRSYTADGSFPNGASTLLVRAFDPDDFPDFPTYSGLFGSGTNSLELYGNCNNGATANSAVEYKHLNFTPRTNGTDINSLPVYKGNATSTGTITPGAWYTDIQLTGDNKTVFASNLSRAWIACSFGCGNGFAASSGTNALAILSSGCAWFYRPQLRIVATGAKF